MDPRWWRLGVVSEREGEPWTWTFHVRAFNETRARALVAERLAGERFFVHTCHPSDPLPRAPRRDEVVAVAGPYRRSWQDPSMRRCRERLQG